MSKGLFCLFGEVCNSGARGGGGTQFPPTSAPHGKVIIQETKFQYLGKNEKMLLVPLASVSAIAPPFKRPWRDWNASKPTTIFVCTRGCLFGCMRSPHMEGRAAAETYHRTSIPPLRVTSIPRGEGCKSARLAWWLWLQRPLPASSWTASFTVSCVA